MRNCTNHQNLITKYILLAILTLIIILLIILFNIITYAKPGEELFGLPSLGLWKPLEDAAKITNLSENESLIERNKQLETPSDYRTIKEVVKQYRISYIILLLIAALIVAWSLIIFRIYNG